MPQILNHKNSSALPTIKTARQFHNYNQTLNGHDNIMRDVSATGKNAQQNNNPIFAAKRNSNPDAIYSKLSQFEALNRRKSDYTALQSSKYNKS